MQREEACLVRGRHYTERVPTLDALRSNGAECEDEYLALLDASNAKRSTAASAHRRGTPPGLRDSHRGRNDVNKEMAVLERWVRLARATVRTATSATGSSKRERIRARQG